MWMLYRAHPRGIIIDKDAISRLPKTSTSWKTRVWTAGVSASRFIFVLFVATFLIASSAGSYGQEPAVPDIADASGWVRTWGGVGTDGALDVAVDAEGNVYTAGYYWSTVDFDPQGAGRSATAEGRFDVFITKHDPTGAVLWVETFGGPDDDRAEFLAVSDTGLYASYRIGDTYYLQKFNMSDGSPADGWSSPKTIEMTSTCGLAADSTGVYWPYTFGSEISPRFARWAMRKYSPDGAPLWSVTAPPDIVRPSVPLEIVWFEGPWSGNGIALAGTEVWVAATRIVSSTSLAVWCGSYSTSSGAPTGATVSFGPPDIPQPSFEGLGCVLIDWELAVGCGILVDNSGDLVINGCFRGNDVRFAPSEDSAHSSILPDRWDHFVTKISRDGVLQPGWPVVISTSEADYKYKDLVMDMAIDDLGNVYIGGCFSSVDQRTLGGGRIAVNTNRETRNSDALLARIDSIPTPPGSWSWVGSWGTSLSFDYVRGVAVSGPFVYAVGIYANEVDFSPWSSLDGSMPGFGEEDAYLARYRTSDGLW